MQDAVALLPLVFCSSHAPRGSSFRRLRPATGRPRRAPPVQETINTDSSPSARLSSYYHHPTSHPLHQLPSLVSWCYYFNHCHPQPALTLTPTRCSPMTSSTPPYYYYYHPQYILQYKSVNISAGITRLSSCFWYFIIELILDSVRFSYCRLNYIAMNRMTHTHTLSSECNLIPLYLTFSLQCLYKYSCT